MNRKRRLITRLVGLSVTLAVTMSIPAPPAFAYNAPSTVNAIEPRLNGWFGQRTASPRFDYSGDGVNDVFLADSKHNSNTGVAYLVSGASLAAGGKPTILKTFSCPSTRSCSGFGYVITALNDVNGDAKPDVTIGVRTDGAGAAGRGAFVYSGHPTSVGQVDNTPLKEFANPWVPQGRSLSAFGSRIGNAGDVTGDGKDDVIVGDPDMDVETGISGACSQLSPNDTLNGCRRGQGRAYIFNSATGARVRDLNLPASDVHPPLKCANPDYLCSRFGLSVQGPGDIDGDLVTDQLVAAPFWDQGIACGAPEPNGCRENQGRMYLFSGATGNLIRSIDVPAADQQQDVAPLGSPPGEYGMWFGFQDAEPRSPGDVNGDGRPEIYGNGFKADVETGSGLLSTCGTPEPNTCNEGQGKAWVFNGATGGLLYAISNPSPGVGRQFGWSLVRTDHNGGNDLYIGNAPHHYNGGISDQRGDTNVFDGANGALLQNLPLPAPHNSQNPGLGEGPNLGWTVTAPGDLNGDQKPDYVAGAPFTDVTYTNEGVLVVYKSH